MSPPRAKPARRSDAETVRLLREGDEAAFLELVATHHASLFRVARGYVRSDDVAEEVVQETWVALLKGLERFEGRSSLKTYLFRILANRARTRARREVRTTPMSAIGGKETDEPALSADHFDASGGWNAPPARWHEPLKHLENDELGRVLAEAIAALPERQRLVLTLRDVQGWSSADVRNAMDISETNQRVLLHRARTKVRTALAPYVEIPS